LSSRNWDEIYIIDHSTTTAEAAGHTGGNTGKGGDILWRWGNPEVYGAGDNTNRMLFGQHDARWIQDGFRHEGKISVFNNGNGRTPVEYSSVDIISPEIIAGGNYDMDVNNRFLPTNQDYIYSAPVLTDFYSATISGAHMLGNGNMLITEGTSGHFFEIDSLDNIVWDYVNPVVKDSILEQEEVIPGGGSLHNRTFRATRIAHDFSGLPVALLNQGPIEINPYPSTCVTQLGVEEEALEFLIYPSPANNIIQIKTDIKGTYIIINSVGKQLLTGNLSMNKIDVSNMSSGIYYMEILNEETGNKLITNFIKQ